MNNFNGVGRLTSNPELRVTQSGKSVANFKIAINRNFNDETDFFNCVAWGKLAENIANYVIKGQRVAVTGRLQSRKYDDKQGITRYIVEIVANEVEFLSKPEGKGNSMKNDEYSQNVGNGKSQKDYSSQSDLGPDLSEFEMVDEDEVPF